MKWKKLGRVHFTKNSKSHWAYSHDHVPTVDVVGNVFKVYVAHFDDSGVKRIGLVELNANNPVEILRVADEPVLDVGEPGTFDDSGVVPSYVYTHSDGTKYLYYFGWQLLVKTARYLFAGLAVSIDGGNTFKRHQQTPILERLNSEKFLRSTMSILKEDELYRCWYGSSNKIIDIHGHLVPSYNIRHTTSKDGIVWEASKACLRFKDPKEFALIRPWVIKESGLYKMFYSVRKIDEGYSLGYAESGDGHIWQRKDSEIGIGVSKFGWDSEMVCFTSIADHGGNRYMFYNGNNYGESGFGAAILEKGGN
jgi:hypothetical protein